MSPHAGEVKRRVGLVGKGLTFDSGGALLRFCASFSLHPCGFLPSGRPCGLPPKACRASMDHPLNKQAARMGTCQCVPSAAGYNLKVGVGIEMMKFDMGGSAAVLGAARALANIQPDGVEARPPAFLQSLA